MGFSLTLTHLKKHIDMCLAISGAQQFRVAPMIFINVLPIEIGYPRFNLPSGYTYHHHVITCPWIDTLLSALIVKLPDPALNTQPVPINHHDKAAMDPVSSSAIGLEFLWKTIAYMFFTGPTSMRKRDLPNLSSQPTHLGKKTPHEDLMLLIFTKQDQLRLAAHVSQPLAMISDKRKPFAESVEI